LTDDVEEAEREAGDEVFEANVVKDEVLEGGDVIGLDESFGGGKVFPLFGGVLIGVFDVARLEGVRSLEKLTVFGNTTADAGGEGKVDGLAFFTAEAGGFVESS